ncbi:MAG: hypothetical protein ACLFV2_08280 [Desulfurivibrionaceae bacterium]
MAENKISSSFRPIAEKAIFYYPEVVFPGSRQVLEPGMQLELSWFILGYEEDRLKLYQVAETLSIGNHHAVMETLSLNRTVGDRV